MLLLAIFGGWALAAGFVAVWFIALAKHYGWSDRPLLRLYRDEALAEDVEVAQLDRLWDLPAAGGWRG